MAKLIYTIGHSTKTIDYFLAILKAHDIEMVVDVRTIPRSKHNPQFNEDALKESLRDFGIRYRHLAKLGGLRHTTSRSIQTGWRNASFRGFADYMETPPFWKGVESLEKLGTRYKVAIMCAEAVPWRCHRSLIADALLLHKWKVRHIQSKKTAKLHKRTPFLHVKKGILLYK
jgi:uncharacterized protein (DUF488 family)